MWLFEKTINNYKSKNLKNEFNLNLESMKTNIAPANNDDEEVWYEEDLCPRKPQIKSIILFIICHLLGINAQFVSGNKLKIIIVRKLETTFPKIFLE